MKNKHILLICICLAIITLVVFVYSVNGKQHPKVTQGGDQTIPSTGQVSQASTTLKLYENDQLGLKFYFPTNWHLGSDTLADPSRHGHMQLFNYDENVASGKSFLATQNKIEVTITDNYEIASSSDYPEKGRVEANLSFSGNTATRTDITLADGQSYRVITIPMNSDFLRVVIYGDPVNFDVLDTLMKTIEIHQ